MSVCASLYAYMRYVFMHICIYKRRHIYVHAYTYFIHKYMCIDMHMYVYMLCECIDLGMYVDRPAQVCVCTYECSNLYIYVCM